MSYTPLSMSFGSHGLATTPSGAILVCSCGFSQGSCKVVVGSKQAARFTQVEGVLRSNGVFLTELDSLASPHGS